MGDVVPYKGNPRKISKKAVSKVAESIKQFGWRQPIVVDAKGVIIVGHTRLLAAKELGQSKVPVHVAKMTEAKAKAYRLADNRTGEEAVWDNDLLVSELDELLKLDFDLADTGFDLDELIRLKIEDDKSETEDAELKLPKDPITKPGDIWVLGDHRLICGDSTDKATVEAVLAGKVPNLMITDPPYGVNYDPAWRNIALGAYIPFGQVGKICDIMAEWVFSGSKGYSAGSGAQSVRSILRLPCWIRYSRGRALALGFSGL